MKERLKLLENLREARSQFRSRYLIAIENSSNCILSRATVKIIKLWLRLWRKTLLGALQDLEQEFLFLCTFKGIDLFLLRMRSRKCLCVLVVCNKWRKCDRSFLIALMYSSSYDSQGKLSPIRVREHAKDRKNPKPSLKIPLSFCWRRYFHS